MERRTFLRRGAGSTASSPGRSRDGSFGPASLHGVPGDRPRAGRPRLGAPAGRHGLPRVVGDTVEALYDGISPASSGDQSVPRFTWWDHTGGTEWVRYEFPEPITASATEVYWFDDTGQGQCRVPVSWRLLYRDGEAWRPVENPSAYGTARDTYNRTTFTSVRASAFRLEAQLGSGVSGGILEWRITG